MKLRSLGLGDKPEKEGDREKNIPKRKSKNEREGGRLTALVLLLATVVIGGLVYIFGGT